jgi:hypothetical protein
MSHLARRFWAVLDYAEYLLTFARLAVLDWLYPPRETPVDPAIREEGERLRKAFPMVGISTILDREFLGLTALGITDQRLRAGWRRLLGRRNRTRYPRSPSPSRP